MSVSKPRIQETSARLGRLIAVLSIVLWVLLLLERFGEIVPFAASHGFGRALLGRFAYQFTAAWPEAMYILSLEWIRQAMASLSRGDLYAPIIPRMLSRVGAMLAAGAFLNSFIVPLVDRALGMSPGYWIAFDVSGLVLGIVGLSFVVIARVLNDARELKAELDGIF